MERYNTLATAHISCQPFLKVIASYLGKDQAQVKKRCTRKRENPGFFFSQRSVQTQTVTAFLQSDFMQNEDLPKMKSGN